MGKFGEINDVLVILKGTALEKVTSIIVTNPGSGYTSTPSVSITGGGGTGATAIAIISNQIVTGITITNVGDNYTSYPSVSITGGGGTGATALAFVDAIDLSNKWSVIEYENAQPQGVTITFNARAGRFLTKSPILKKRYKIYVEIIEKNDNITKDVFHVRTIILKSLLKC